MSATSEYRGQCAYQGGGNICTIASIIFACSYVKNAYSSPPNPRNIDLLMKKSVQIYRDVIEHIEGSRHLSTFDCFKQFPLSNKLKSQEFFGCFNPTEEMKEMEQFDTISNFVCTKLKTHCGVILTSDLTRHSVSAVRDSNRVIHIFDPLTGKVRTCDSDVNASLTLEAMCMNNGNYDMTLIKLA